MPASAFTHDSDLDFSLLRDLGALRGVITSPDVVAITVSQSPYTILIPERFVIKTDSGTMTIMLPLISTLGALNAPYVVENGSTGAITLTPSGSDTIDNTTISNNSTHVLMYFGTAWHTISTS